MNFIPRILITPGEPSGIGPDIAVEIAQHEWDAEIITVCDPELLSSRAEQIGLPLQIENFSEKNPRQKHQPRTLKNIALSLKKSCTPGLLDVANASYVMESITLATDLCLNQKAEALVTGPVQKSIMNEAGMHFTGHTEFLASRCNVSQSIMLFVADTLRVALATTHIPLAKVSTSITQDLLLKTLRLMHQELIQKFKIANPTILVAGLNPHAGENGYLGREEIEVIQPALNLLREENINIMGPLPADTLFTHKYLQKADAILAMYHDQALPIIKNLSFGHAVNLTLGLPIIRTSVDHGTALDLAGTKKADPKSLSAAVRLAIELGAKEA